QSADIGSHAHVDFLDRELRIGGCVTHVAGGNQVDGAAQAISLDGRQYRFAAIVDGVEGCLELENLAANAFGVAADVLALRRAGLGQHLQVDPRGKMFAGTGYDHGADGVGVIDPAENLDDLAPEIRVHGVDLVRTIDHHVGDLVCQLDVKCFVVGHGS